MSRQQALSDAELNELMELLIDIAALQRLRHCWAEEVSKDSQWRMKFTLLKEMIAKRCAERDETLARVSKTYPEIRNFTWLKQESFDA